MDRAAAIAAAANANLIVATAYFPHSGAPRDADVLRDEAYQLRGNVSRRAAVDVLIVHTT